tara:strand:+ start:2314 stop:2574 length:261 start_codon:yes stop_codon:yes gene_type:complete
MSRSGYAIVCYLSETVGAEVCVSDQGLIANERRQPAIDGSLNGFIVRMDIGIGWNPGRQAMSADFIGAGLVPRVVEAANANGEGSP